MSFVILSCSDKTITPTWFISCGGRDGVYFHCLPDINTPGGTAPWTFPTRADAEEHILHLHNISWFRDSTFSIVSEDEFNMMSVMGS